MSATGRKEISRPDGLERPPRERLLDSAGELFYREGYRAVGVDRLVAHSGVAKMTLYRHFPAKDDLIVAYLERSREAFWLWFAEAIEGSETAREKLVALFAATASLATAPQCLGCAFQATAAEFPAPDHPGLSLAQAHKKVVLAELTGLAAEAGAKHPDRLAAELLLLMDGAFASARMFGSEGPASSVAIAAEAVIEAELANR